MKIIRWILLIPVTAVCFFLLPNLTHWIISIIERIIHFITTFGTWYYNDGEMRFAIVTIILSYLISGGFTGVIGGYLAPIGNAKVTSTLVAITTLAISIFMIIGTWNTESLFVSLAIDVAFLLSSIIATAMANTVQKRNLE